MTKNIKTNKKYLLLIPLVVSLIMLLFFSAAFNEIVLEKYTQRYQTVQSALNCIVSVLDQFVVTDGDWGDYDYPEILKPVFADVDDTTSVNVVLLDHNLTPLSGNFIDDNGTSFDLLNREEFVKAVAENDEYGELTITNKDTNNQPYEILVYFKKIPSGDYENKLIAVYGVSKYAIDTELAPWLVWGVVGMVSMTVLLQVWMILYISKLSDAERHARGKIQKRKVT